MNVFECTAVECLKAGRAVCQKYGLTQEQCDVLRYAARKYREWHVAGALHDGTVSTYNRKPVTIDKLLAAGFIAREHQFNSEKRSERAQKARSFVADAFRLARVQDPWKPVDDADPKTLGWEMVYAELKQAQGLFNSIAPERTVLRITAVGRAVAIEWKVAIGAEEE